uniref:Reverse transcriptase domain-containing protein n=1 Tax=Trichuris muris TaxID=70415 RepID=A0A5S6Q5T1_TRIMR
MGCSLSLILAEVLMEHFEEKVFANLVASEAPTFFKRYVDDIFAIIKVGAEERFLEHLNSLFPDNITLTIEKESRNTLVIRKGTSVITKVYRKATSSDRDMESGNLTLRSAASNETEKQNASMEHRQKPPFTGGDLESFAGIKLDNYPFIRMMYILVILAMVIVVYFGIKIWRTRNLRKERVYDVLPIHQLGTNLDIDSDSEDDVFDDAQRNLVVSGSRR